MKRMMKSSWYIDPANKIIGRKRIPITSVLLCWLGVNKTRMRELYLMIRDEYHDEDKIGEMMQHEFPLDHDNFPKPEEYPYYFRLVKGWRIEPKSVQFLTDGPLFSENKKEVVVHSRVFVKSLFQKAWRFVVAIALILGLISSSINIIGKLL